MRTFGIPQEEVEDRNANNCDQLSYVIVNPEKDLLLEEGDIIYIIRQANIEFWFETGMPNSSSGGAECNTFNVSSLKCLEQTYGHWLIAKNGRSISIVRTRLLPIFKIVFWYYSKLESTTHPHTRTVVCPRQLPGPIGRLSISFCPQLVSASELSRQFVYQHDHVICSTSHRFPEKWEERIRYSFSLFFDVPGRSGRKLD